MVTVVNWNPRRKLFRKKPWSYIPLYKRPNNFGDLIGPVVVDGMLRALELSPKQGVRGDQRLLTVGSILHLAQSGDVIWGSGVNGKIPDRRHRFSEIDVRAVRGPLTRDFLLKRSIPCPEIFGDPGILLVKFYSELFGVPDDKEYDLTIIPNLNDYDIWKGVKEVVDPTSGLDGIARRIASSRFVVGTSLHAIVLAESMGVPARLLPSPNESDFKYEDYYLGTGRGGYRIANSISQALDLGGEPSYDVSEVSDRLIGAFPKDLWL
ncbi:MAG: polysaccharide pyruvyl transferase family protein [Marinobacter sp.]|uniref:polysaccharide pyruvyl transferase family protein n=1 Tax=Marinobacter sp. TaxID=50741 RepID=UPI00299D64DF|nr:polysaccharide pyruvyl transferase family protein [Marinobacter sp.]MDX1756683.1 polysaccharide pyruvyl transferase family protein [Marinobacter sp.]